MNESLSQRNTGSNWLESSLSLNRTHPYTHATSKCTELMKTMTWSQIPPQERHRLTQLELPCNPRHSERHRETHTELGRQYDRVQRWSDNTTCMHEKLDQILYQQITVSFYYTCLMEPNEWY